MEHDFSIWINMMNGTNAMNTKEKTACRRHASKVEIIIDATEATVFFFF